MRDHRGSPVGHPAHHPGGAPPGENDGLIPNYLRDYEVIVYTTADPRTGIEPAYLRYLFRYCVEARCESSVPPETWRVWSERPGRFYRRFGHDLRGRRG
ncbi:YxiG-like protein [Nonomuraea aurantiaca]|uniref:YxiG-like protein n=1 Tax=Nonomuraea aurantiaca TaxID=2878562 RepID=UPI003FD8672A